MSGVEIRKDWQVDGYSSAQVGGSRFTSVKSMCFVVSWQVAASPVQTFLDVQISLASPSTRLGGTVTGLS